MSSEPMRTDAFEPSTDASVYVPRVALESALAELSELIGKTPACAALTGAAGLGKTLLLHVLHERLAGAFECLQVPSQGPSSPLTSAELWSAASVALGLGSGDDDRGAVLGRARSLAADDSGVVLLVDDAAALPAATRSELIAACETPGFSLVLAIRSDELAQLETLPAQVRRIDLGPPMTLSETRAYVQARLRNIDPDGEISARLGPRQLSELHEASGGVPARLHDLLAVLPTGSAAEPSPTDEPGPLVEVPIAETAAEPSVAEPILAPSNPNTLQAFLARLQRPRVQLGMAVLLVVLTGGFWFFALQRVSGTVSVGVPVERFQVPSREAPPEPAPAAPRGPQVPAAAPVASPAVPAEQSTPAAQEPRLSNADGSNPTVATPVPDPARSEAPVQVVSSKFPDEHVPATSEATPLAPPPAGPRLNVTARPWAEIQLDGNPVGETPLGELSLAPGPHVVTARLPDGSVIERSVEAKAGDLYLVFPPLDAATDD